MVQSMKPKIACREVHADEASTLAVIGSATLLEAFAGWLPGISLLAHCRANHSAEAWLQLLAQPGTRAWLAEVEPGAAPVGYALLVAKPEFPASLLQPGDMELRRIYVFSRFHGSGAAPLLHHHVTKAAQDAGAGRLLLGVHEGNARALAFYHRNGYTAVGRRTFRVGAETFDDPVLALNLS
jgi:ribosomal protein S18 acetylase RimI-like enzyme